MASETAKLENLLSAVADVIERRIRPLLPHPYRLTLLAYVPGKPEADVMVSRCSLKELSEVLVRLEEPAFEVREEGYDGD